MVVSYLLSARVGHPVPAGGRGRQPRPVSTRLPVPDRTAQGFTNHLFRTACPAFVLARIGDANCKVVSALISRLVGARWAACPVVATAPAFRGYIVQDAKFAAPLHHSPPVSPPIAR